MTLTAFISGVLALLLAPGPTNTLMGLAGTQRGIAGVARLLPAELVGYLTAVLPLAYLGTSLLERWPAASVGLKAAAALWVLILALRLWGGCSNSETAPGVTKGRVFVTTMLNPKALVFGLILLPAPEDAAFLPRLALFCGLVVGVALVWGACGALARMGAGTRFRPHLVHRVAAVWLAMVALMLIADVIRA